MQKNHFSKFMSRKSTILFIVISFLCISFFQNCGNQSLLSHSEGNNSINELTANKFVFAEAIEPLYLFDKTAFNQEQINNSIHAFKTSGYSSEGRLATALEGANIWPGNRLGFVFTPKARLDLSDSEREILLNSLMNICQNLKLKSGVECLNLDNAQRMPSGTSIVWIYSDYNSAQSRICKISDSINYSSCGSFGRNTTGHNGHKFGWISISPKDIGRNEVIHQLVENILGLANSSQNLIPDSSSTLLSAKEVLPIPRGAFTPRVPTKSCTAGSKNKQGSLEWCPAGYQRSFSGYVYYEYTCIKKQNSRWGDWTLSDSGFDVSGCKKIVAPPDSPPITEPRPQPSTTIPNVNPEQNAQPIQAPLPEYENDQQNASEDKSDSEPYLTTDRLPIPAHAKPPLRPKSGICRKNSSNIQRNFMPCPSGYSGEGSPASVVYIFSCNKAAGSDNYKWVLSDSYFDVSACRKN